MTYKAIFEYTFDYRTQKQFKKNIVQASQIILKERFFETTPIQ